MQHHSPRHCSDIAVPGSRRPGRAIALLALSLLTAPLADAAQPPAKVPRVGFLGGAPATAIAHALESFRQGLRELGWFEGKNIAIEYRHAEGRLERLPDLAAELVRLRVDVIVTAGTPAIQAAQQVTRTIPIVMAVGGDPLATGIVASLARPGGNITGLSLISTELSGKRLELLKEIVPAVSRIAVLSNPTDPVSAPQLRETETAARALRVQLQSLEVREPDEFERAFQAATQGRAGALLTLDGSFIFSHRTRIVGLAAKSRLPAMYGFKEFVDAGGLMSYATNLSDMYRRAATYVDKILKGAKPADLPVEQPTRFELVINLKTAKALGLTIPPSILIRADHLIQ